MRIIGAIGDGSCLIHSILLQICEVYNKLDYNQKSNYVRQLRKKISTEVSKELFDSLSNGNLKEVISYEDWINHINSTNSLGEECLELFSHYFEINIHIWWKNPIERYPINIRNNNNYKNVNIYWTGNHYDALFE